MNKHKSWRKVLAREQLDERLRDMRKLRDLSAPPGGWIKAVRFALGMSGRQMAERLGVTKQSVSRIENAEPGGSLSLGMMRRAAEALDCSFFYCLIPNVSLDETVRRRAEKVAWSGIDRANRSMRLEGQGIPDDEVRDALEKEIARLVTEMPRSLWDGKAS